MLEPLSVKLGHGRDYTIQFCTLREAPRQVISAGLQSDRALLVTDERVNAHYAPIVREALEGEGRQVLEIVLPPGEQTKSQEWLQHIYDRALAWGIDRDTCVFGLGGGVVGDLAGFAAATLLRGLPLVHLPTSLIAQVDSAIGGKTGINHATGKNLIGSFYQPALVCVDPSTLHTLPEREWRSGLAEVVKHALIGSRPLFEELSAHWSEMLERTYDRLPQLIRRAAEVKTAIVSQDEREHGRRMWLNFGHTMGHAIENVLGYGTLTHGEAVTLGMETALFLSAECTAGFPLDETLRLVQRLSVHRPPAFDFDAMRFDKLYDAMRFDKKNRSGKRRFVLLNDLADPYVTDAVSRDELAAAWRRVRTIAED